MINNNNQNQSSAVTAYSVLALVILVLLMLDFSQFFNPAHAEEVNVPVITSVGRSNVKVGKHVSSAHLIQYTIPDALLRADPAFLKLMKEAEKYIGYPYVYGGSRPETSFDCSGFVCWVFRKSGVCQTGRLGANGLHDICQEISAQESRPGDLVFFKKTMGNTKGITHVGIYVGNNMMIHAGDPIGFADIAADRWQEKLVCYGRLPVE